MAARHLTRAVLFALMAVQFGYNAWALAGDSPRQSGLHLVVALLAAGVVTTEIRRGRRGAHDSR